MSLGGAGWGPSVEETVFDQLLPSATGRVEQRKLRGVMSVFHPW